jgi:ATP-dependent Lon protease
MPNHSASLPASPGASGCQFSLPLGRFKQVYDTAVVRDALADLPHGAHENLRDTYEKMLAAGGERLNVKPSSVDALDTLFDELPNFREVLGDIRKQLALAASGADSLEIAPILLLGPPGIGKTHFAKRLSQLLGTGFGFLGMSALTAGWIIGGTSSGWKNAKPGKVFETLVTGHYANPVLVVDEIDKAGRGEYDPLGSMYSLLEHDTAREFIDEFAEVPVDAADVIWIATANDDSSIPEPILSRMNVFEVPPPDEAGVIQIARSIYRDIRNSHDWGRAFPEEPGESAMARLAELSPRDMRRIIFNAFGAAKLEGRDVIEPRDIADRRNGRRQRMGF